MYARRSRSLPFPKLTTLLLPLVALFMAAPAAAPAAAQSARGTVALVGGGSAHGDLTPGLATSTVLETGWLGGLQAERWLGGGRTGLRFNTWFSQRNLDGAPGDYNVYSADVDLLVRLFGVRPDRGMAPYIALGAGAVHFGAVGGSPALGGGAYGSNPVRAHLLTGLGVDISPAGRSGIRLEVADQIVLPSIGRSPPASGLPMVHNLVVTAGLQLHMGRLARPMVAQNGAPPVAPSAPASAANQPALYTVQVESFVEWDTARRWRERLLERDVPVWLLDTEIQGERVSRVRVGAAESESQARQLASALESEYGWRVQVDRVNPSEPYPTDAVAGTRAFLQRR